MSRIGNKEEMAEWQGLAIRIAQEEKILQERLYFKNELLMLLEQAGFHDIIVHGDHPEAEATAAHGVLVFIARKCRK